MPFPRELLWFGVMGSAAFMGEVVSGGCAPVDLAIRRRTAPYKL